MPGVTVTVRNQENGTFRTTVSGVDGSFFVSAMNPGVYQVEAMLDGFRPYERKDVRLEVGRTISIDVTLELGGIEERLTVTAEAQPYVYVLGRASGKAPASTRLKERGSRAADRR